MLEILEHTADTGFRASGGTLAELFENAALALVSVVLEPESIAEVDVYPIAAAGDDVESLLVNWLSEVLYYLDGDRVAIGRFQVDPVDPARVTGKGFGEPRDAARHRPKVIVKGVTYHQLKVVEEPAGWTAEVYLDI